MVKILAIDAPERLAQIVDETLQQFKRRIEAELYRIEGSNDASQVESAALPPNQRRVRALIGRCRLVGREIKVRDVIHVAGVDEARFFIWQRGGYVSDRVRRRCETAAALSVEEFLERLDAPVKLCSDLARARSSDEIENSSCNSSR